jgi:hypothetical protein
MGRAGEAARVGELGPLEAASIEEGVKVHRLERSLASSSCSTPS